tara:strand:- start:1135 stop:1653 length:519 start_codon:yes stop_codon:yes gene_type:complete
MSNNDNEVRMDIFDSTEYRRNKDTAENQNKLRELTYLLENLVDQPDAYQRAVRHWLFVVPKQCYGITRDTYCGNPTLRDKKGEERWVCHDCQWKHWELHPPSVSPSQQRTLDKMEVIWKAMLLTENFHSDDLLKQLRPLWKQVSKKDCQFSANKLYERYQKEFEALKKEGIS